MATDGKRICISCGKEYKYCPRCREYAHLPKFMFTYCSEECKDVDYITASYANGHIKATEAKELLEDMDLTKEYIEPVKTYIIAINAETNVPKKSRKKIVNED